MHRRSEMVRSSLVAMSTELKPLGRNTVLVGDAAILVSLGRAFVDLLSKSHGDVLDSAYEVMRINLGFQALYILSMLGLLSTSWLVIRISRTHFVRNEQVKLARSVILILACQAALFDLGLVTYVVNELTLHFHNLTHPGIAGFAWEYPLIGGLILVVIGYSFMYRSLDYTEVSSDIERATQQKAPGGQLAPSPTGGSKVGLKPISSHPEILGSGSFGGRLLMASQLDRVRQGQQPPILHISRQVPHSRSTRRQTAGNQVDGPIAGVPAIVRSARHSRYVALPESRQE